MKKPLRVDAEAEDEIAHAIDRYESEREGLGLEFWTEMSDAMDTLDEPGPECGRVIGLPPERFEISNFTAVGEARREPSRSPRSHHVRLP